MWDPRQGWSVRHRQPRSVSQLSCLGDRRVNGLSGGGGALNQHDKHLFDALQSLQQRPRLPTLQHPDDKLLRLTDLGDRGGRLVADAIDRTLHRSQPGDRLPRTGLLRDTSGHLRGITDNTSEATESTPDGGDGSAHSRHTGSDRSEPGTRRAQRDLLRLLVSSGSQALRAFDPGGQRTQLRSDLLDVRHAAGSLHLATRALRRVEPTGTAPAPPDVAER